MIRSSKTWHAVAVAAAAGLVLSACGTTDTDGGGDASGEDCNFKIGAMGALSGANASIVLPSVDGAELALEQWDNDECDVTLERFDTEGDPQKAVSVMRTFPTPEAVRANPRVQEAYLGSVLAEGSH